MSIFGLDKDGKVKNEYIIEKNGLVITNVDIQQVEPVDGKTKQSLKETVSLAIQIYDYKKKKSIIVFGPELVMLSCCSQMKSSLLTSCLEESQRYQELSNHSRSSSVLISHQISLRSRLPITLD